MRKSMFNRGRRKKFNNSAPNTQVPPVKAFPTAIGAGAQVTGGRGGQIIHVTNLNDSGPGSLRAALQTTGTRIIVFDVSGVIVLSSLLSMNSSHSNVTIAGQTAPEGGITIDGARVYMSGVSNVICRYIRFKGGVDETSPEPNGDDSLTVRGNVTNQIWDHCSFAFGADEAASWNATGASDTIENVTVQNCLFAESDKGSIIGGSTTAGTTTGDITFARNLFINTRYRFPNVNGRETSYLDVINNVAWNAKDRLIRLNGAPRLNHIGNFYAFGPTAVEDTRLNLINYDAGDLPSIFTIDNKISAVTQHGSNLTNDVASMNADNTLMWKYFLTESSVTEGEQVPSNYFTETQHALRGEAFSLLNADNAFDSVIADVGCNKYINADGSYSDNLDTQDAEWIGNVDTGTFTTELSTANYIASPITPVTRDGSFYSSNAHIPETWFSANVPNGEDETYIMPSGYSAIEEYINSVD